MKREYVIVNNEHKPMWSGCVLFWGHLTDDDEPRSFGGYTNCLDKCEKYTKEELDDKGYGFPFYDGENESEFRNIPDICIKVKDLLNLSWLKEMHVVYRP
ncbi:MAG: hypothetical protein K5870_00895 [Lachnospiraceae bacterium]|nr:hypothetical protein [Lachnospiraceae bacterium]